MRETQIQICKCRREAESEIQHLLGPEVEAEVKTSLIQRQVQCNNNTSRVSMMDV